MWEAEWSCVCFYSLSARADLSRAVPLSLSLSLSPPLTLHASAFLQSHNFVPLPPFPPSFLPLFRFLKFQYAWNSPHALLLVLRISLYCTPACEWVSVAGIQRHPPTPFPSSPHCQRVIRVRPGVSPTVLQAPIFPPLGFYLGLDITARKEQNDELAEVSHDPPPHLCPPHSPTWMLFVLFREHLMLPLLLRDSPHVQRVFLC